jgi:Fur family ferric uptake transcriptional regulator
MEDAIDTGTDLQRRTTRQRAAIQDAIAQARRPLLPAEILAAAQRVLPALGMATVYRNLKLLVDGGEVQPVELPGEPPRYESAHQGHHHHFQCRVCERVFDMHRCPGDFARLAPQGFQVERHELTLYGLCADCARQA